MNNFWKFKELNLINIQEDCQFTEAANDLA
jgi:hypothetical protein